MGGVRLDGSPSFPTPFSMTDVPKPVDGSADPPSLRPDTGRAGIVIAGDRSERFDDTDKALVRLEGDPLISHVVSRVAPAVDELVVNCRRDQRDALAAAIDDIADVDRARVTFALDGTDGQRAVAGIRVGLRATEAEYAVLVPCDVPRIEPAFLAHLLERARHRTGAAIRLAGHVEVLPSAVHVRAAEAACTETLADDGGVDALRRALDPIVIDEREVAAHVDSRTLEDVDTPADLRRLRARLESSGDR